MVVRAIAVAVLALLLAGLVGRQAFVDAYAAQNPARAAAIWPGHPSVILASGLAEVGAAAASRRPVNSGTVRQMLATATKAPLAPEPFLVRGVEAQVAGDETLAFRAFLEARDRDPRSIAAHYFLADHYLKVPGQTGQGLAEISALTRLVPQSLDAIAPHLAAFARAPGGAAIVRKLLRDQPQLEPLLLSQLAADPNDTGLALSLWSGRNTEQDRPWQERLVNTLVTAGRFREARTAWARFEPRARRVGELVDPQFESRALPPFGWTLASGAAGVAEPEGGGRLHILYYGRDNLMLASQQLLLAPGQYQLSMRLSGVSPSAKSLAWTVRCLRPSRDIAAIDFGSVKGGALALGFTIPPQDCQAQELALSGTAPDIPEQADLAIAELRLTRSDR